MSKIFDAFFGGSAAPTVVPAAEKAVKATKKNLNTSKAVLASTAGGVLGQELLDTQVLGNATKNMFGN